MSYEIEKGVPLPANARSGQKSEALMALEKLAKGSVGDSMFLPAPKGVLPERYVNNMATVCARIGSGWYAVRKDAGGARAWKIGEPKLKRRVT